MKITKNIFNIENLKFGKYFTTLCTSFLISFIQKFCVTLQLWNCGNPNGKNKKIVASPVGRKRKRESRSPYERVRSADYLASVNLQPSQKVWTVYEQCLLMTIASFLTSTLVSPSADNVVYLFNQVANSSICKESKFSIRAKNNLQIAGKLQKLEKKGTYSSSGRQLIKCKSKGTMPC